MKLFIVFLLALSSTIFAHEIEGTQVLKGTKKTKLRINDVKSKCVVDVEKVRNLMEEDSFGNPAYSVRVVAELSGEDKKRKIKLKHKKEFKMINLFREGDKSRVEDFKYVSLEGNAQMEIDDDGRLKSFSFPFEAQKISCLF